MFDEVKCAKCGKEFVPAPLHVYVEYSKYYCSWHCFNNRKSERKRHGGNVGKIVEQYTVSGDLVNEYESAAMAGACNKLPPAAVAKACRNNAVYKGFMWKYK